MSYLFHVHELTKDAHQIIIAMQEMVNGCAAITARIGGRCLMDKQRLLNN